MAEPKVNVRVKPEDFARMTKKLTHEQIMEFREAFSAIDQDGDGVIRSKELGKLMRAMGENPTEQEVEEIVVQLDLDGDGTIDFPEFLNVMVKRLFASEDQSEWLRSAFRAFDMDGSGYISLPELEHVMTEMCDNITDEEIKEMFDLFDVNKDGRLSFQEFATILSLDQDQSWGLSTQ
ncbi:calmodulin-like [Branchiostoma lanceolatum]|uniref:CALM1 protein n=1 Tax=Branchiostoma lanceolatum TaxID=7740 RepID=A0A8J9VSS9_BRALA|nr:CALM1 [Branchiostoma lanceolatum]